MTIRAVMLGIEARLQTISGLRTSPIEGGNINPPQAIVGVPSITDYQEAMARGKHLIEPTVTVLVSTAFNRTGQMKLADYAALTGPESIPAAIAADRKLGGAAEDCQVLRFEPLGFQEVALVGYFGGVFRLRCMAR